MKCSITTRPATACFGTVRRSRPSMTRPTDCSRNEEFCFGYDLNGNLIEKQQKIGGACTGAITEYTYNPENQLIQVAVDGNPIADYRYDALGRRIQKETTVGTQKYIYDGVDIVLEYDASDQLQASYLHSLNIDEPLLMRRDENANGAFEAGENFYYQADRLGSILALTDEIGAVAESYVYQGFGEASSLDSNGLELDPSVRIGNPYAFTAREFESQSGLYYYRARYYDPQYGRFIQEDPIGVDSGEGNLYRYVFNSPINFVDPNGKIAVLPLIPPALAFIGAFLTSDAANAPGPGDPIDPGLFPGEPVVNGLLFGVGGVVGGKVGKAGLQSKIGQKIVGKPESTLATVANYGAAVGSGVVANNVTRTALLEGKNLAESALGDFPRNLPPSAAPLLCPIPDAQ